MQIDNEEIEAPKLRPAVYLRVSTEDQWNKYWLKIQEDAIINFIKNRFDYDENNIVFYKDIWISWTLEYKKRPQLNKLFEDIKYAPNWEPPFDVVVVYKIDRFARDLKVLLEIIGDLKESNVSFASTQELIDTSTPFGKAMLGILWVFAELDRDMIVMKTHEWIDKALSSWVAYREVFWYKKDKSKRLIIHQEQAEIVKRIFYMFTELNYPISKIAETLSNEKIPIAVAWDKDNFVNKDIKDIYSWKDGPLRVILSNEIYTWKHYYHKQVEIKDKITGKKTVKKLPKEEWKISKHFHDPIIDNLTFEKAEKLLNVKKWNFKSSSEYILWGLIKCDHCKEYRKKWMVSWTWTSSNWWKILYMLLKKSEKISRSSMFNNSFTKRWVGRNSKEWDEKHNIKPRCHWKTYWLLKVSFWNWKNY